jgi:hypothetical protein
MPRSRALALLLAAGAANVACEAGPPTAPAIQGALAQRGSDLPFKETYGATGTIVPSAGCPAGTFLVSLEGGGTATHVGRYTISNSHCLDLATGAFTGGTFLKTAASGDQLLGTYTGGGTVIVAPAPPDFIGRFAVTGTLLFTGGTGRFAGASGTLEMRGTQVTDFSAADWPTDVELNMKGTYSW